MKNENKNLGLKSYPKLKVQEKKLGIDKSEEA